MKTQKGITLIALIITIIVMLILVGVSVTVALNGGLFNTAQNAAEGTKVAGEKERLLSIALGTLNNEGEVDFDKLEDELEGTEFTLSGNTITSEKTQKTYVVSERGSVTEPLEQQGIEILPKKETYTIGEEVTINNESFYVIGGDEVGEEITGSAQKLILLAKDNINTTSLKQVSEMYGLVTFTTSDSRYWAEEDPLDLNEYEVCPEGSAIDIAKQYAEEITGSREYGRLMTKGEAESLIEAEYSDIVYGINGKSSDYFLLYYLGTAASPAAVYYVNGDDTKISEHYLGFGNKQPIRPVLEISKSAIQ